MAKTHQWWTNVMNNIPRFRSRERLFTGLMDSVGKRILLRSEKQPMKWKMYLVFKFCKVEELMVDTFASTSATAKAHWQLPEQCSFVGFEKDSGCSQDGLSSLLEVHAKQVSRPDPDMTESTEVINQSQVSVWRRLRPLHQIEEMIARLYHQDWFLRRRSLRI